MKSLGSGVWARTVCGSLALAWASLDPVSAAPAPTLLTRAVGKVELKAPASRTFQTALKNQEILPGSVLRTGPNGAGELVFPDRTVIRLSGKTEGNLAADGRSFALKEGALLYQAPASARGGVKVTTGGLTLEIRGTTGILERYQDFYAKMLVVTGTGRIYLSKLGESVLVRPGQMIITKPSAKTLPEPVNFSLAQLARTSLLLKSGPLPNQEEIARAIAKQKADPALIETNLVIFGRGTLVNLLPPSPTPTAARKNPRPSPTAAPPTVPP